VVAPVSEIFSRQARTVPTCPCFLITGLAGANSFLPQKEDQSVQIAFLGQGPWTPWQMFSWGLCGLSAGFWGRKQKEFELIPFLVLGGIWGYLFGWIMNLWHWLGFVYPLTLETFIVAYMVSLPFDTLHAASNVVFSLIMGRSFYRVLTRFKSKLFVQYMSGSTEYKS